MTDAVPDPVRALLRPVPPLVSPPGALRHVRAEARRRRLRAVHQSVAAGVLAVAAVLAVGALDNSGQRVGFTGRPGTGEPLPGTGLGVPEGEGPFATPSPAPTPTGTPVRLPQLDPPRAGGFGDFSGAGGRPAESSGYGGEEPAHDGAPGPGYDPGPPPDSGGEDPVSDPPPDDPPATDPPDDPPASDPPPSPPGERSLAARPAVQEDTAAMAACGTDEEARGTGWCRSLTVQHVSGGVRVRFDVCREAGGTQRTVQFATAQELDVVVRGPDGTAVWTWSRGQSFAASSHAETVNPSTCHYWSMVWNAGDDYGDRLAPGSYTVEVVSTGSPVEDFGPLARSVALS